MTPHRESTIEDDLRRLCKMLGAKVEFTGREVHEEAA